MKCCVCALQWLRFYETLSADSHIRGNAAVVRRTIGLVGGDKVVLKLVFAWMFDPKMSHNKVGSLRE